MKTSITILFVFISLFCFAEIPTGYYDGTNDLTGDALKSALNNIIDNHTDYPYTSSSTDTWDILKESDRDPNNPDNVILIYTGWSVNAAQEYNDNTGWSREHVWAKSHGFPSESQDAYRDAHHLRPCDITVNSARGTKDFDNGGSPHSEATECNTDSDSWEPRDAVKGDIARMMFYMATRYEGENGDPDLELVDYTGTSTDTPFFGKLSTLLQWNTEDPVDEFEQNRNEVVYSYQGNRNPFVDHPEFVKAIYEPEDPTGFQNNQLKISLDIFPNPVLNELNIISSKQVNCTIYTIIGEKIISTNKNYIDASNWKAGIYFIVIKDNLGQTIKSEKIIKK